MHVLVLSRLGAMRNLVTAALYTKRSINIIKGALEQN